MKMYKAAIIGCGRIGSEFDEDPKRKYVSTHAGAYSNVKGCRLAAACDSDEKRLNKCIKRWSVPAGYSDYKEMMAKESVAIVSVCTPPGTHYPIIKDIAASKGLKAIFCEKPLSGNLDDARKIVKVCRNRNIILQVDHQRRFDLLHQELRRFIGDKKMERPQHVNFYYTGGIRNTGSHMFDLLRFLFGEAEWIEAFSSKNSSGKKDDPNLDGMFRFKNGLLATFQACDGKEYLIFELNCLFEKGRIVLKNSGFSIDFYEMRDSPRFTGYKELFINRSASKTEYKKDFMVKGVEHLLDCVEKKHESISSGEDGLKALELVEKAVGSARRDGCREYLN